MQNEHTDALGFSYDATHDHAGRSLPRYNSIAGGRYANAPLPKFDDCTEVRQCHVRSWLDPRFSRILARSYADRLIARFKGKRGLFLTLTYRRDDYDGPRDLYRKQADERHLRRFIEKLAKYLGHSLTAKWCAKMEFQTGGWVHWHLAVETTGFVKPGDWPRLWPHGFAKAQRLNRQRCNYFCKYFAKSGDVPAFLYFERPRSVTIVRSSPGFWDHEARAEQPEPVDASQRELTPPSEEPPDDGESGLPSLPVAKHACPCFVPLGHRLTQAHGRVLLISRPHRRAKRQYRVIKACIYSVICTASLAGCRIMRRGRRCFILGQVPASAWTSGGAAAKRPAALDLIEVQKPPKRSAFDEFRSTPWVQMALTQLGVLSWG